MVSYEARLAVDNLDGLLRPGMTATATIQTASTGQHLLVPNSALRFDPESKKEDGGSVLRVDIGLERQEQRATIGVGSRQIVHVLQADDTLKPVAIVTGQSDGRWTVVSSGDLSVGMKVATAIRAKPE